MKPLLLLWLAGGLASAELLTIPTQPGPGEELLDPGAAAWKKAAAVALPLQRTPPLYSTDKVLPAEIAAVEVRVLRAAGKTWVHLDWKDATADRAELPKAQRAWQSESLVVQSRATDRFFDACAVMVPATPITDGVFPSLQMGDLGHPVTIYTYDVTRGPFVMGAAGRGTTHRTGDKLRAQSARVGDHWQVSFELPEVPGGAPLSFAIWNGSQQDRDGRKYFSIWHRLAN